jgi:ribosome maturation factor RimP
MLLVEMDRPAVDVDRVRDVVEAAVAGLDCELWEIGLAGPPGHRILRVFIESSGGVDIERCTRVSRALRPLLDDPAVGLADADLEVSSPGAERELRGMPDYLRFIGSRVNVRFGHGDAERVLEGTLLRVSDDALTIEGPGDASTDVPLASLLAARLAVRFGADDRPRRPRGGR